MFHDVNRLASVYSGRVGWDRAVLDCYTSCPALVTSRCCDVKKCILRDKNRNREAERQSGREAERQRGREAERQSGRAAERQSCRAAERQSGRAAERQSGREAERQSGREAERQRGREAERQKDIQTDVKIKTATKRRRDKGTSKKITMIRRQRQIDR